MTNKLSMRYRPEEMLSGLLASVAGEDFSENTEVLGETFNQIAQAVPMFKSFAANGSAKTLSDQASQALKALVQQGVLKESSPGTYHLDDQGKAHCKSMKRTLFNRADIGQLEDAAKLFDSKCSVKA